LPQELTCPEGRIVWSARYDAVGRLQGLRVDEVAQPLRLQGQYWDQEIGLCYNRYRYFDPHICSFISQDPIGLAGGENVYAYAPNVWGWLDPLGLCAADAESAMSTGRTTPRNLEEQLAMEEVMSNPKGTTPPRMPQMSDTKNNLFAEDGWIKRTQNVNGVEIHYVENTKTGKVLDFKFKD
jgi:RHS repeat-associated protein